MSGSAIQADPLETAIARALGLCRSARLCLLEAVGPCLPHRHRDFVRHVARVAGSERVFDGRFATDLETLIGIIDREIERGTVRAEVVDTSLESVSASHWTKTVRSEEAQRLAEAALEVRSLLDAVHAVRDAAAAERIGLRLRDG